MASQQGLCAPAVALRAAGVRLADVEEQTGVHRVTISRWCRTA